MRTGRDWIRWSAWAGGGCMLLLSWLLIWGLNGKGDASGDVQQATPQDAAARFEKARPKGLFIVIDTARNMLFLRKGDEVLLEARCSTGSGLELVTPDRTWRFKTPQGSFKIISKARDPVWRKPDWAFLEEGKPVPQRESERYESDVLGEYALGIGDGYFIHGTLYQRLLGTNVTHGCVRLGDKDLEFLAKRVPIGTRVFIF